MNSESIRLEGTYFDGLQPYGRVASLSSDGDVVTLVGPAGAKNYSRAELHASPRIATADRFITFPDRVQFQCADSAQVDAIAATTSEGWAAWLEARVALAVFGIVVIVAAVLAGYFYGLPKAAEFISARISVETERVIGDGGLEWMDQNGWFEPTKLDDVAQDVFRKDFDRLRAGLPQEQFYRLEFRNSPRMGANAFALPGGTIVVTDAMAGEATGRDEFAAIIAHEFGHIEHRHTLRLILQNSAVLLIAATVAGDTATIGIAGIPTLLAQAKFSREFESDADEFAFALLKQHGKSPEAFARVMSRIGGGNQHGFLSSHPLTEERIKRARAAAQSDP